MDFINELMKQHEEFESPRNFWYWSALASLSAVLGDKVYLDKFQYKMYPNIYVLFHADSGMRKGAPVALAKKLVQLSSPNTRVISGRSSIQGILKEMGTYQTTPDGKINDQGNAFICASELTSSMVEDPAANAILTDLYDRNWNEGSWKQLLKSDQFEIKNPTVTMLSATNEAHANYWFAKQDIQGGFLARTCVIYENQRQTINSLMFEPKYRPNHELLIAYLRELAKLKGEVKMSDNLRRQFHQWYQDFLKAIERAEVIDKTGTLNRFDDTVLKVALLISLGREPNLEITQIGLDEALSKCEELVGNIRRMMHGVGKSEWAHEKSAIMKELVAREGNMISRKMLNRLFWMSASAEELDEIMNSLQAAGIVYFENRGNEIFFVMPPNIVEELTAYFSGKNLLRRPNESKGTN